MEQRQDEEQDERIFFVQCWSVQKVERDLHYVTLYTAQGKMCKCATRNGCHFAEKSFYIVRPKSVREKVSKNGKEYLAFGGTFIERKITRQDYYRAKEAPQEVFEEARQRPSVADKRNARKDRKFEEFVFEMNFGYHKPGGTIKDVMDAYGDLPGMRG